MARLSPHLDESTRSLLRAWRAALPDDRLAHLVRVAERGLRRALQVRLSEHDVSFGHWIFLRILWEQDGLTQRELAVLAGVMEPTAHTALHNMQELGYVTRRHLSGNRKKLHIFLTDVGRNLQDALLPLAVAANEAAAQSVSRRDIEITRQTLLKMISNLETDEAQALDKGLKVTSTQEIGKRHSRNG